MLETGNVLTVIVAILDIIAIVHVLTSATPPAHKILWIVVILLLPLIGLILYYFLGRRTAGT